MLESRKTLSALITLSCDSKCRHCYIDSQPEGTASELSPEVWRPVLTGFRDKGGEEFCIHGGEPLLYKGLGELLLHARDIGLRTSVITNAVHLDDAMIDIFSACATYVLVSLDGPQDNYVSVRGINELGTVIDNIDKLLQAKVQIQPIQIVHKNNVHDLSWIVDFCLSQNIHTATLSPIQPIGRAEMLDGLLLSPAELCTFIETLLELNRLHEGRVRFVTQSLYRPQDEAKYLKDERSLKGYEDQYYYTLNDGSLTAAFDLPNPRDFILGSVFDLANIDQQKYLQFHTILDSAFLNGLKKLRLGHAINWDEVLQREILDSK